MIINNPVTIFLKFFEPLPKKFEVFRNDKLYFERFLNGKTQNIKFNIPDKGNYTFNIPAKIEKITNIKISPTDIPLPKFERNRIKDFKVIDNPNLQGTPARVFTDRGIIEKGAKFYNYPLPMRKFLLLHEIAHFYYSTEEYCDLLALNMFTKMGYNISSAMYCLTNVLSNHKNNDKRIKFIYDKLNKYNFINGN